MRSRVVARARRTRFEPMKPAPPVTRIESMKRLEDTAVGGALRSCIESVTARLLYPPDGPRLSAALVRGAGAHRVPAGQLFRASDPAAARARARRSGSALRC